MDLNFPKSIDYFSRKEGDKYDHSGKEKCPNDRIFKGLNTQGGDIIYGPTGEEEMLFKEIPTREKYWTLEFI